MPLSERHLQRAEVTCRNVVAHLVRQVVVRIVEKSRIHFLKYSEAWHLPDDVEHGIDPSPEEVIWLVSIV